MLRGYFGNDAGLYICMAVTAVMATPLPRLVRNITFGRQEVARNLETAAPAIEPAKENIQDGDRRAGEQGTSNNINSKGVSARNIASTIPEATPRRIGFTRSEAKTQTRRNRGRSTRRHNRRRTRRSTGTTPSRPRRSLRKLARRSTQRATEMSETEDMHQDFIHQKRRQSRRLSKEDSFRRRRRLGDSKSPLPRRARGDQPNSDPGTCGPFAKQRRRP